MSSSGRRPGASPAERRAYLDAVADRREPSPRSGGGFLARLSAAGELVEQTERDKRERRADFSRMAERADRRERLR